MKTNNNHKVAHLTSVHSPFDVRIFHKECKSLKKAGFDVTLIAPHDKDEVVDNIQILGVKRATKRLERMFLTTWRVFKRAYKVNASVYHFHDPELFFTGLMLKILGKKVIYDVHENLPTQIQYKEWINDGMKSVFVFISKIHVLLCGLFFNGIIPVTKAIADTFPKKKVQIVQNFPIMNEFQSDDSGEYEDRSSNIIYIGGIGSERSISEIIMAMDLLPKNLNVKLKLVGEFANPDLEKELKEHPGFKRVDFPGWQSRAEVKKLLSDTRAGLVIFQPYRAMLEAQPNKLFEYMSAGIPVIASNFPLWREISNDCGVFVNPLSPQDIANAIQWIVENPETAKEMGKRGRESVISKFNWEIEAKKLILFYGKLLRRRH